MATEVIRIFSDLHYGDHSSRIAQLASLAPLAEGADSVILNGDSLDTRSGPDPDFTAACRTELGAFFRGWGPPVRFLTGNHDPDFSPDHFVDLADGKVFITHGDILYPDIVPWGRDAPIIRAKMTQEWHARSRRVGTASLAERFAVLRRVAADLPQRHQAERSRLRHAARLAIDVMWPPWRFLRIVNAWQSFPRLADEFLWPYRPNAQVMLAGHTHRPGIWRRRNGTVLINTGSFCRPFGAFAVDLSDEKLRIRSIRAQGGEFRLSGTVAELRLRPSAR